ncbi:MAG: SpoIID/LytB domain-containing protein [Planctomycetota bacterium]
MDSSPEFWVRVLLLNDVTACTLKSGSALSVIEPKTSAIEGYFGLSEVPMKINVSDSKITIAGRGFRSNELIIMPGEPYIFNLNGDDYRGKLKIILNSDGSSFDVINHVPLEPYLAGVVGAEMPDYWESSALQAQSVAARTYCLYIKRHFGNRRTWDVKKTQANQVYRGVSAESPRIWDAVSRTSGQILVSKKQNADIGYELFPAYYSSTCGGHTENSNNVFRGDSFESLSGVGCPYCRKVAKPRFFLWPMVQFDKDDVTGKLLKKYPKLKALGEIINIAVHKQSNYGEFSRLTSVKLLGSTSKSEYLNAEDLRLTIDPSGRKVRSTICQIVNVGDKWRFLYGRGWGHGVGMCQCGAQAIAREGKSARQILSYYYPGSRISTIDY